MDCERQGVKEPFGRGRFEHDFTLVIFNHYTIPTEPLKFYRAPKPTPVWTM